MLAVDYLAVSIFLNCQNNISKEPRLVDKSDSKMLKLFSSQRISAGNPELYTFCSVEDYCTFTAQVRRNL